MQDIKDYLGKLYTYKLTERKTQLENVLWNGQKTEMDGIYSVLCWFKESKDWLIQVSFSTQPVMSNNYYYLNIYNWRDMEVYYLIISSNTVYPPVWNREFCGLDFIDFIHIQKRANDLLAKFKLETFEIDDEPVGKMVVRTKESPDEILKLIAAGKSYSIYAIKADVFHVKGGGIKQECIQGIEKII